MIPATGYFAGQFIIVMVMVFQQIDAAPEQVAGETVAPIEGQAAPLLPSGEEGEQPMDAAPAGSDGVAVEADGSLAPAGEI